MDIQKIRKLVTQGKYELSKHAEKERQIDMIYMWELEDRKLHKEEVNNMPRVYHNCYFCGGEVLEKRIAIDYRWGEDLISIIENVPTGVCQVCGEQYFKAEIVKEMERLAQSKEKPKKVIEVPLRELAAANY